jgi:hypothetical protein
MPVAVLSLDPDVELLERCEIAEARVEQLCRLLAQAHSREQRVGGYCTAQEQLQRQQERAAIVECGGVPTAEEQRYELACQTWAKREA